MSDTSERRHDLDALRAFAMLLGLVLHAVLAYAGTPWTVVDDASPWIAWLVPAIHSFRMPLFFLLSGFFTAMLWRRRGLREMIRQRALRIALPLALGMITIIPLLWMAIFWAGAVSQRPPSAPDSVWAAARLGDVPVLRDQLARGAAKNGQDPFSGVTPLGWAVLGDHEEAALTLLEQGADPNAPYRDGNRPLTSAVFLGRAGIVRALLDAGADRSIPDASGFHVTQIVQADRGTTEAIVRALQIPAEWDAIAAGRAEIRPLLGPDVAYMPKTPPTPSLVQSLMNLPLFHHLWFLWHLCWLVVAFALVAWIWDRRGYAAPPFRSGWLWAAVLATVPLMTLMSQSFGTDTSIGLIPFPHVLATYAIFFGVGAWVQLSNGLERLIAHGWWALGAGSVTLAAGMALEFLPGANALILANMRMPVGALLEALAAWCLAIGMLRLASQWFSKPSAPQRYLADASYWLYLAHLPLIIAGQGLLTRFDWPAEAKALVLIVGTMAVLLPIYELAIRYTWAGALLNGRRTRTT